jgi:hypothetical protein
VAWLRERTRGEGLVADKVPGGKGQRRAEEGLWDSQVARDEEKSRSRRRYIPAS